MNSAHLIPQDYTNTTASPEALGTDKYGMLCVCNENCSLSTNIQQNIFIILYIDLFNDDGNKSANKVA